MEVKTGYKQTEVGVIPEEWEVKPLGEIGGVRMCKRVLKHQTRENGDVPFYKIGTFGGVADAFIPQSLFDEFRRKYSFPRKGDILISAAGTIGRTVSYDGAPAYFQDSNIVWIDNDESKATNAFLWHRYQVTKWSVSHGGTVARLYNDNLRTKIYIAVPSLPEQHAIAEALSDVDGLLGGLDRLIAKKRDLKQAAMQQLLTGQTRLPGFHGECEVKRLGSVADVLKGNGLSKSLMTPSGTRRCILYGELFTNYNRVIAGVSGRTHSSEGCPSIQGDVLMPGSTTTTGIDLATASALLVDDVALGGDIIIVRRRGNDYDPVFLANYLTQARRHEIAELTQGITIHHLYGKDLKTLSLELPPHPEQTAIAEVLTEMDAELAALEQRREKTRALKQAMMQELLTGRTRLV
jgi:type I restriction enzyme S subunit